MAAKTRDAWSVATPEHRRLFTYLLRIRMHVIVTMRAKKETVATEDEKGKQVKKLVLDPIQREDVPYLFDVLAYLEEKQIRIDTSHCPTLEEGSIISRSGPMLAHTLRDWLKGDPMPERPEYDPDAEEQSEAVKQMVRKSQGRALKCGAATDTPSWELYVAGVLGIARATSQITLDDIARINGDLAKRERAKQSVEQPAEA